MSWVDDEGIDAYDDRDTQEVRCKHCQERDLFWAKHRQQWVLMDGEGYLHHCPPRVATADEFEVVS